MMLIWVFGFPFAGLVYLIKKRKLLEHPQVKRYFIVLYQGYRDDRFFWEFVNVFRKVTLLSINVFFSQFNPFYKGGVAVIIIVTIFRIQIKLKPYVYPLNNECELISSVATGLTILGGLVFTSSGTVPIFDLLIFMLIAFANFKFFLFWTYLMSKAIEGQFPVIRKLSIILSIILNKKDNDQTDIYELEDQKPNIASFHASKKHKITSKKKPRKLKKNHVSKGRKYFVIYFSPTDRGSKNYK